MPGCTGQAQEATGFGARSTSTKHIRQFPAIISFLFDFVLAARAIAGIGRDGSGRTRGSNIYTLVGS